VFGFERFLTEENILNDSAAPECSIVCRQWLTGGNLGFMSPFVRSPAMNDLSIRTMRPDEISTAVNWAAAEGWNPGLADDACFAAVDPEGFLIGEARRRSGRDRLLRHYGRASPSSASTSCERTCAGAAMDCDMGCGHCARRATRDRARWRGGGSSRTTESPGFELAYANVRYGGIVAAPDAPQAGVMALAEVPLAAVEAYDATVFPAPRPRSCGPGSARPGMSVAPLCAMAGLSAGA